MSGRRRYATQADIAALAGVSRATVSLAIKGSPHVSSEKRERVLAAAESLGYVNNAIASALAGNRSRFLIGLLVQSLSNPVFTDVHEAVEAVLGPSGHSTLVMCGGVEKGVEDAALRTLTSLRPDGIMLAGYSGSTSSLHRAVQAVPVVSITREIAPPPSTRRDRTGRRPVVRSVVNDDRGGAALATEHILSLGHTRVVHLRLPRPLPYEERVRGYTDAMEAGDLRPRSVPAPITVEGAMRVARKELSRTPPPTAFFCGNDVQALGVLDAVADLGLVAGREVSVVGYDNTSIGARAGLTSVDQHARALGTIAARTMLRALGRADIEEPGSPPAPVLVQRASSAPPTTI